MILENVSGENAVKTESQLAVYKKKLEIADQQAKLAQLAIAGSKPEMELLEDQLKKLNLQVKIAEANDKLHAHLLI